MGKKFFFVIVLVLVCSVYTNQSESKATITSNSASVSIGGPSKMYHKHRPPYMIVKSQYVSRSTIKQSASHENGVRIRIMQNGIDNTEIEDFSLEHDSGTEYRMGNIVGIDNSFLPLYVKVTYRSWNTFHAVQFDVTYEFVIFYPGTWDVTICN